jgi:hypothetical protein
MESVHGIYYGLLRLLDDRSKLTLDNNVLIYNLQQYNQAYVDNIKRIQSLQSKVIRKIASAPFYICNHLLHKDLNVPFVSDLATSRYKSFHTSILNHENPLVQELTSANLPQSPPLLYQKMHWLLLFWNGSCE